LLGVRASLSAKLTVGHGDPSNAATRDGIAD